MNCLVCAKRDGNCPMWSIGVKVMWVADITVPAPILQAAIGYVRAVHAMKYNRKRHLEAVNKWKRRYCYNAEQE